MLHPIGSRPPAVYWRRRLAMSGAVLVLVVITAWVLRPGGDRDSAANPASHPQSSPPVPASSPHPRTSSTKPASTSAKPGTSTAAAPVACDPALLTVAAVVDRHSYSVGDKPVVLLQVTNPGPKPCVQDLADTQIELRVYNGASRVWGSHDCTIEPGTDVHTLAVRQPVRVSVVWSGLSSQPKCAGTRQRVGAGTYTLYALLSGHEGTATQFAIS